MIKKENMKDGLHKEFHENDQLKFRGNYKDGKNELALNEEQRRNG
jgi:antitoxin component YwqK of YwqJK toxin-antitoxin module